MRISGIILALAAAVLLSAPSAHGQKRQKDSLDESLVFTDEYLDIVRTMAKQRGLTLDDDALCAGAERFALARGGRSPRCAKQYVESLFC